MRILMVCLGNICRSPLAEGILKSKLPKDSFTIDSAGTSNYHIDELPDRRSIDVAKKHHIDITNQRGRQFTSEDFDEFDLIYAMDSSNFKNIKTPLLGRPSFVNIFASWFLFFLSPSSIYVYTLSLHDSLPI